MTFLKINVVSREHNRVADDGEDTQQWYGIYTAQEFYSLHERMCQIDSKLETLVPIAVQPIKSTLYSSSSFVTDFRPYIQEEDNNSDTKDENKSGDLHDNRLCRELTIYLDKACEMLGRNLFVDILFNGISKDNYFEVYSEFSLKRITDFIET